MADPGYSTLTDTTWPSLPLAAWQDTYETLHLWTQIVGKIRLTLAPQLNHPLFWATCARASGWGS